MNKVNEPQPIMFPGTQPNILHPDNRRLTREDVVRIVHEKVSEILYYLLRSEEEVNIVEMSEADFDAFIQRVMCSDEAEV